jgi:hypothetical protein
MDKVPKDKKGQGRKRKHNVQKHERVNWKHPLIFALIMEVQQEVKRFSYTAEWSPAANVK